MISLVYSVFGDIVKGIGNSGPFLRCAVSSITGGFGLSIGILYGQIASIKIYFAI